MVSDLTRALYERYRIGPIDLRYRKDEWCVMLPVGNQMMVVDGSFADTPEQALQQAIERWDTRSPEHPFGWSPGNETSNDTMEALRALLWAIRHDLVWAPTQPYIRRVETAIDRAVNALLGID